MALAVIALIAKRRDLNVGVAVLPHLSRLVVFEISEFQQVP
jgi:hypothetical protein